MPSRLAHLAHVLTRDAGLAAARAAAPFIFGLGIVVAILFGGNGMRAEDAVHALAAAPPLRLGLFAGWILATAPAARLLFETPSTFYLRAFPLPRWHFLAVATTQLTLIELPWIALYWLGAGPVMGLAAGAACVGVHASLVALTGGGGRDSAAERILALASAMAVLAAIAWPVPWWGLAAAGAAGATISIPVAWRRAPERDARRRAAKIGGRPPAALARALLVIAWRTAASAFSRALVVVAAGAALTALVARNDDVTRPSSLVALALGMGAVTLTVTLGGIVEAIHAAERSADWLLASTGTSGAARVAAAAGAAGACGLMAGIVHGAGVAIGVGADPATAVRLVVTGAAWSGVLGAATSWAERWADRGGERSGGHAVVALIAIGVAGAAGAAGLGDGVVVAGALVTAALLAAAVPGASRRLDPPPGPGMEAAS